jgi:hypothetical protein
MGRAPCEGRPRCGDQNNLLPWEHVDVQDRRRRPIQSSTAGRPVHDPNAGVSNLFVLGPRHRQPSRTRTARRARPLKQQIRSKPQGVYWRWLVSRIILTGRPGVTVTFACGCPESGRGDPPYAMAVTVYWPAGRLILNRPRASARNCRCSATPPAVVPMTTNFACRRGREPDSHHPPPSTRTTPVTSPWGAEIGLEGFGALCDHCDQAATASSAATATPPRQTVSNRRVIPNRVTTALRSTTVMCQVYRCTAVSGMPTQPITRSSCGPFAANLEPIWPFVTSRVTLGDEPRGQAENPHA